MSYITSEILEDWQNKQMLVFGHKSFGAFEGMSAPGSFSKLVPESQRETASLL
jgi:hypothetical protein